MYELTLSDEEYRTLRSVLYLVEQADHGSKAVWLDEYDRQKVTEVLGTIREAEESEEVVA